MSNILQPTTTTSVVPPAGSWETITIDGNPHDGLPFAYVVVFVVLVAALVAATYWIRTRYVEDRRS